MKSTIFIILFVFLNVLIACNREEPCGPYDPYFRIQSIYAANRSQREIPHSTLGRSVQPTDTVELSKYFVNIRFGVEYYSQSTSKFHYDGMLYALSCIGPGSEGSKEGIRKLDVITLNDYNSEYKANDTISNALEYGHDYPILNFEEFLSKPEFMLLYENSIKEESFAFRLIEDMDYDIQAVQFKIILELTNGDIFETTTDSVKVRR